MSYERAIFHTDLVNGSDAARAALTGCNMIMPMNISFSGNLVGDLTSTYWSLTGGYNRLTSPNRFEKPAGVWCAEIIPINFPSVSAGEWYKIVIKTDSFSGNSGLYVDLGGQRVTNFGGAGTFTYYHKATSTAGFSMRNTYNDTAFILSYISVQKISWNGLNNIPVCVNKVGHGLFNGAVVTVPSGTYAGDWLAERIDADNFTLHSSPATGIIEVTGTPVTDETFVIGTQTFTFKELRSGTGEVTVSSDNLQQVQNIIAAIQADITNATAYNTSDYYKCKLFVQATAPGTRGNSIVLTGSATGISVSSPGTLSGGTDSIYSSDRNSVTITPVGGMSFTDAWLSFKARATGDLIRIAKSSGVTSLGTAKWTGVDSFSFPPVKSIAGSTNSTPIEITTSTNHGYSTGDVVQIIGHAINSEANGAWVITCVNDTKFTLDGSVGNGIGASSGTTQLINAKAVVLSTAQTQTITNCETVWTPANSAVVTLMSVANSNVKEGQASMKIAAPASLAIGTKYAYYQIPSTDFSTRTHLNFWCLNEVALMSGNWKICLCDDTAGDSIQDTFFIPAQGVTGRNVPYCIARSGGGHLHSAVRSVALYSNTVMPAASKYLMLDNIFASSGLNLLSLISKSSTEVFCHDTWHNIQSINGKVILLENNSVYGKSNTGRGYFGTTESVTTYRRETIQTAGNSSIISGRLDAFVYYDGGYNTSTGVQDGLTYMDNRTRAINSTVLSITHFWLSFNNLAAIGGNRGLYFSGYDGVGLRFINIESVVGCGDGSGDQNAITIRGYSNVEIVRIGAVNNSGAYGLEISNPGWGYYVKKIEKVHNNSGAGVGISSANMVFDSVSSISNNGGFIFSIGSTSRIDINAATAKYNGNGIFLQNTENIVFRNLSTEGNGCVYMIYAYAGKARFENVSIGESAEVGQAYSFSYKNNLYYSFNHDKQIGNHKIFEDFGSVATMQTSAKYVDDPVAWEIVIASSRQDKLRPFYLKVGEHLLSAGTSFTFYARIKLAHATNAGARLVCKPQTGIAASVSSAKAANTDWEDVSIQVMPSVTAVIEFYIEAYYLLSTTDCKVYVGRTLISET